LFYRKEEFPKKMCNLVVGCVNSTCNYTCEDIRE